MSAPILVFGHDAYRAGAQIELLHLVQWLKTDGAVELVIVLGCGGELLEEYARIAPTFCLEVTRPPLAPLFDVIGRFGAGKSARGAGSATSRLPRALRAMRFHLLYLNSVASLPALESLHAVWRVPVVCHVHELEMSIRRFSGLETFRRAIARVSGFIAASAAVEQNLLQGHGIPPGRVHRIYEGIRIPTEAPDSRTAVAREVRQQLGIPAGAFVVGACGTLDWRKGPDVFVQVAALVHAKRPPRPAHFVWVGGNTSSLAFEELRYDVERMGLAGTVHLVGAHPEPQRYFAMFDAFLLTSREDPFPLVCLEATSFGIPIVCFAKAGGMPEFVGTEAGFVVPYLDLSATAERLLELARSEPLRSALGEGALEKVKRDHEIGIIGKQIAAVIKQYI